MSRYVTKLSTKGQKIDSKMTLIVVGGSEKNTIAHFSLNCSIHVAFLGSYPLWERKQAKFAWKIYYFCRGSFFPQRFWWEARHLGKSVNNMRVSHLALLIDYHASILRHASRLPGITLMTAKKIQVRLT